MVRKCRREAGLSLCETVRLDCCLPVENKERKKNVE